MYDSQMVRPGMWAEIAHLVLWLAVGWMVQGSNPSRDDIFCAHPYQPRVPPSLLWNWYHASLPGMKWPGCGPPPRSGGVKERLELYLYSFSVSSCQVIGWTYVYLRPETWCYVVSVSDELAVFVVGPAGPTTNTSQLSPRYEGKTRGCHCSQWAPGDGRENARNILSCKQTSG
jgi:hypothetical protein